MLLPPSEADADSRFLLSEGSDTFRTDSSSDIDFGDMRTSQGELPLSLEL